MHKDFKKWHSKKSSLNELPDPPFSHEGEIWFCHLGVNIGSEQDGLGNDFLRPIAIIRKFNREILWGVPLTRTQKKSLYYFAFPFKEAISVAILSQVRLIDARRLGYLLGSMASKDLVEMRKRLKALIP